MFRTRARQYNPCRLRGSNSAAPLPYVAAMLAFAVTAFAPQVLNDGDTYLHLSAGSWMLQHHALLSRDIFSFTHFGQFWQTHEWLSEILMASAFQLGGWGGLLVLCACAAAAASYIIATCLERIAGSLYAVPATILSLSCVAPSLLARPHLLVLPVMAFWSAQLVIARSEKRPPSLTLLPVMAIWANLHASFPVGLALSGALGIEVLFTADPDRFGIARQWLLFTIAATAMCLLTPYGIDGLLFPIRLISLPALSAIGEWRSIGLTEPQPIYAAILGIVYLIALKRVRLSLVRAATIFALAILAFLHNRHQMIFGVITPMLLAEPVATRFASATIFEMRLASIGAMAGLLVLTAARLLVPLHRTDSEVSPINAIAHVPQSLRAEPVLNDYAFGGYLIFTGIRPFIDSRAELYGEKFLERYLLIIQPNSNALNAAITQYHIQWAVLSPSNPAATLLSADPRWDRLYMDQFATVYVRRKKS